MSYYQTNLFSITDHALKRAIQRLKLNKDLHIARVQLNEILNLIDVNKPNMKTRKYHYFLILSNKYNDMYVMTKPNQKVVITIKQIGITKKMAILDGRD